MVDGVTGQFYTRAGQTHLANDGSIVNAEGMNLEGYAANPDGTFASTLSPLKLSTAAIPPKVTKEMKITANLDSTAVTPAKTWDVNDPAGTSNFSTSMKVYDSLGNAHDVDVYFRNTGPGAWEYHAIAAGGEVTGGTPGKNFEFASGTMTFTTGGALDTVASTSGGTVDFVGATAAQPISFDFGTPISSGGTGLGGTTQFAASSNVSAQSQDGYASGDLSGVKVDADGTVSGVYTNGQKIAAGKLAIAKFRSNDGLARAGHNVWAATPESGEAALGTAGSGGRASVVSGALEQSTVDVAAQFVDLIAHQRAFQANSKTITTADEMLQETMNLKR
jgi:flagellar hook protein FlgE